MMGTVLATRMIREERPARFPINYGEIELSLAWEIVVDDDSMGPLEIYDEAPSVGTPPPRKRAEAYNHPGEPTNYLICTNVSLEPIGPTTDRTLNQRGYHWRWTCTFKERGYALSGVELPNPMSRPTRYWMDTLAFTRAADVHYDWTSQAAAPMHNSAKQPFDPPLELEHAYPVHVIQRNEGYQIGVGGTTYADIVTNELTYEGKINSLDVTINGYTVAASHGLMLPFAVTPEAQEFNYGFWQVTYRIAENPDGWKEEPLDWGRAHLVGGKLTPFRDEHGDLQFDGGLLNGIDGTKLADGVQGVFLDGQSGRLGPYYPRRKADFNALSL